jgi:arylsulfatase A-like enzyme
MNDLLLVTVECWRWDRRERVAPSEFDRTKAVTAGHYTRPSLAGLLTGDVRSAMATAVESQSLAEHLQSAGVSTIAVSDSPQTQQAFGFGRGFDISELPENGDESRGTSWRERLGQYRPVRRLYRRVRSKHATLAEVRPDAEAVAAALAHWHQSASPRFMWLHVMGSHRPYGWGEMALPKDVSRRAATASPDSRLTPDAESRLIDSVADDVPMIICGDHGEELGEHGYFFHGGYRRRLVDELVEVPLATRHVDIRSDVVGLEDIPWLVCDSLDIEPAPQWVDPASRTGWLTVAPWADAVSIRYTTRNGSLTVADGHRERMSQSRRVSRAAESRLEALGYAEVG